MLGVEITLKKKVDFNLIISTSKREKRFNIKWIRNEVFLRKKSNNFIQHSFLINLSNFPYFPNAYFWQQLKQKQPNPKLVHRPVVIFICLNFT